MPSARGSTHVFLINIELLFSRDPICVLHRVTMRVVGKLFDYSAALAEQQQMDRVCLESHLIEGRKLLL